MNSRWDTYKVGSVEWININRNHPRRQMFVDFAKEKATSIIEIGAGELIEYNMLRQLKSVEYTVIDISKSFTKNCLNKFPEVCVINNNIEDCLIHKSVDLIYAASVIEHTYDITKFLDNVLDSSVAKYFYISMFKWSYDGNLKSQYNKKKDYWSSYFNVFRVLDEIASRRTIDYCKVVSPTGNIIDFHDFVKNKRGKQRDRHCLIIRGH